MKTGLERQKNSYKIFLICVKYIPPFATLCLTLHGIICLSSIDESVLDNLVSSSVIRAIFMVICSYAFGFCWLHRLCVIYNLIVSSIIMFHHEIGLGVFLELAETITVISGITILTLLVEHWKGFSKNKGNAENNYKWTLEENI